MERIWLKSYPKGVPAEIDWGRYRSLADLFEQSARAFAANPAYQNMGRVVTFGELDVMTRNAGAWLQARGLAKGARALASGCGAAGVGSQLKARSNTSRGL